MPKPAPPMPWASAAVFVGVLLLNILLMPAELMQGDPLVWISEAKSIIHRGQLSLEEGAVRYGKPGQYTVQNDRNGRTYSKYGLMSSIAVIPPIWGGQWLEESRIVPVMTLNLWYALASAALALMIYRLARRYTSSVAARLLFIAGCFYCSFLWYYLRVQTMELFICIYVLAWYWAMAALDEPTSPDFRGKAAMSWLMVALLVHTRPMFLLLSGLTAVWLGWELLRHKAPGRLLRILMYCVVPLVLVTLSLAIANHVRFGAWYHTGYHQWNPQEHTPSPRNLTSLFGFIADPQYSVFLTFPPLLLSLFACRRFWHNHRRDYVLALILCIGALLFYGLFPNWRGDWAAGPRYVLPALIPASLPCVMLLSELIALKQRLRFAIICLLLAGSCFCWFQVIARDHFAWHRAVMGLDNHMTLNLSRNYLMTPRGLVLLGLDQDLKDFESHPLLLQAKQTMTAEKYANYRKMVYYAVQPTNFYLFRQEEYPE